VLEAEGSVAGSCVDGSCVVDGSCPAGSGCELTDSGVVVVCGSAEVWSLPFVAGCCGFELRWPWVLCAFDCFLLALDDGLVA
jgi:hypothetical protein